ncbi:MAG: transcriptional activator protein [Gemmatimonadales bacterium]|nr:transcriptional activator protein [Gemmatimonadales bacterium]
MTATEGRRHGVTAPIIRLQTFGALDLQAPDGSELRSVLAQPRRVALLAYLALATPRGPHRRDRLLVLFWPDQDEAHARNALSQAVYFLRNALGADVVVSRTADELALDMGTVWCDAIAFDQAVDARRYIEAVELYRGELLAGFHVAGAAAEFAAWLDTTRATYARRYETALRSIAAEREAAGDLAGALVWRRRVAAQDPLNSDAALQLMRAFAAAGDPAAAIRHARVHETLLHEEMDAHPDARITQLVKTLQSPPASTVMNSPPQAPPAPAASAVSEQATPVSTALPPAPPTSARTEIARGPARRRLLRWRYAAGAALGLMGAALAMFAFTHKAAPDLTSSCVAVIPLANYSGDRSQDDLADAVTDALITELARYQRLSVISRTSVAQYKATRKPLPEIARELGCNAVVEGSVVRGGNRVLVDAQLVNALADRHLWAERYERDAADLPALERDIADAIAMRLNASGRFDDSALDGKPARASARRVDPIVYGLYLRGRDAALSRNPTGLRQAIAFYKEAIRRDSTFALGYAGLADSYRLAGGFGFMPEDFAVDSAPAMARAALALDGSLSEAHTSLAGTLTDAGDWLGAEREFRRALQLAPSNALAHHWYAILLITLDRKQEALHEIRRARELDPLSQAIRGTTTMIETYVGIRSPTAPPLPQSTIVDPNHPGTAAARSVNLARAGRCSEAGAENKHAQQLAPDENMMLISRVSVMLLCGDRGGAKSLLAQVERRPQIGLQGVYVAEVHAKLGETDSAFMWLSRTHWGMANRMHLRIDREWKPLRTDPRYRELLRKQNML